MEIYKISLLNINVTASLFDEVFHVFWYKAHFDDSLVEAETCCNKKSGNFELGRKIFYHIQMKNVYLLSIFMQQWTIANIVYVLINISVFYCVFFSWVVDSAMQ